MRVFSQEAELIVAVNLALINLEMHTCLKAPVHAFKTLSIVMVPIPEIVR